MYRKLKEDRDELNDLLHKTLDAGAEYLDSMDERPAAADFIVKTPLKLPEEGSGAERALALFKTRYGSEIPASSGPRFWGFVTGGTTPAALVGDWLVSVYDLNLSNAANSVAPNIEFEAVALLRELFGLPDEFNGMFVSGATMSNFAGLALGREWVGSQYGKSVRQDGLQSIPPVTILSGEAHSSVFKSLSMLGLGRASLKTVPKLAGNREAVDARALESSLRELNGAPAIVVANAGTVNTVDFDDFPEIVELRAKYPFWLHIDAAFGAFAACSPRYRERLAGWEQADSITIDAHKWLNVPYDAAMIFTRRRDLQIEVFQNSGAYLGPIEDVPDFFHLGPENSRRLRALPVWFSLLAYGREGYREIVERNCESARALGELIEQSERFRLLAPVRMNVVCFTFHEDDLSAATVKEFLIKLRRDGRVFLTPTVYHGTPGIRAAFSNWRTTAADVAIAWQAMNECAAARDT
ncbi:MAG TPA: pyridoxal-dependent decarboxylase [Pyrinomonadaceae bacterium]|nr:pyridoxal-dependent decarboxylase [Pyrinomonadaceae bacterium]